MITINKIQLNNFRFFIDDMKNNTFELNGKNLLVYGENGSGKSSLFKAFDFLSTPSISEDTFMENINIFNQNDTYLEFDFSNSETLRIDSDHLSLESDFNFVEKLSVSKPMIEYKDLLKVSFLEENRDKNLYSFFEKILENYPVDNGLTVLKALTGEEYFNKYKQIIKDDIFDDMNLFLNKFNHNIKITDIHFDGFNKTTFLEIEYFNEPILKYHQFLNEARLSALAISIYFAIIKKQFDLLLEDSLKILVLDDLLISLDMNNRLSLIDILKSEFNDFQIFFFTHDKTLFEIFKDKMDWKPYEIYVDENEEGVEIPFIKTSNSLLQQAIKHKIDKNYDCSANLLRQYCEKLLCKLLPAAKLVNKNCKTLDLNGLLQNGISFENDKHANKNRTTIDILIELQTFRRVLLNPASHNDDTSIFKREIEDTIKLLDDLAQELE